MNNSILELEFKGRRTEYAANPLQYPFVRGDLAIVNVDRGQDLGKVSHVGIRPGENAGEKIALTVLRRAVDEDISKLTENRKREKEAKFAARAEITRHLLEMKLVDVELQWDGKKMTFFFTAEGRVDFRDLVRDLATKFRTRIDLRQIGARDETKKISGYGVCGRSLCCATFLTEFKPITTQMPRDQFLPLNPSKLSGVCGRLKCCLRYELEIYRDFQRECPKIGHPIQDAEKGRGEVDKIDVVREQIQVRYGNGVMDRYTKPQFVEMTTWRPEMPKNECICTCGKRAPSVEAPPEPAPHRERTSEGGMGDRIVLKGEGGFRVDFEHADESLDVSTDVKVELSKSAKKKHRKNKPRAESQPAQSTPRAEAAPKPAQIPRPPTAPQPPRDTQAPGGESAEHHKRRRRGGRRRHGKGGAPDSGAAGAE
ncbi:hypothetical protein IT157_08420 [bacterium]|nr:hypothetical protein [bacterium]